MKVCLSRRKQYSDKSVDVGWSGSGTNATCRLH
jgi:hypothetical protein